MVVARNAEAEHWAGELDRGIATNPADAVATILMLICTR